MDPIQILYLEDNPRDAELVQERLNQLERTCALHLVGRRDEYETALAEKSFDLILSDYNLPDYDGLTALSLARKRQAEIPFILISGVLGEEHAVECMRLGATDYVVKHRLDSLVPAVSRALRECEESRKRRQAEESFREQEMALHAFAAVAPGVMWLSPPDLSAILYVSPSYEKIWGRTVASLYADPQSFVEAVLPEDRDKLARALDGHALGRYFVEYRILRPDGSMRWILDHGIPIRDEAGKIVRIAGFAADITDQREAQEQLHQSQKLEALGLLAGGIAHDFSNMLSVILGYSEIIIDRIDKDDCLHEAITAIADAGKQAANLTRQLLVFSRKETLPPSELDLNAIVSNMETMLRRLIGENVDIVTTLAMDLGKVMAAPGQIEQIIMNLAVNARDAMPKGGKLIIETANVELTQEYAAMHIDLHPGPYTVLTITDNGHGMNEGVRNKIFEPFFTTKEPGKGTGLGLSTVYGIVKQSGGTITVASQHGHGTTFRIYLPCVEEAPNLK
jgi:PAS domain S-box-containing protein